MEVEEGRSIDEIFESVRGYDIVFTSEVAMADALNERLEEPVIGHFATTPIRYTMSRFQNEDLLREKGLFIEVANNTDLSWRQSSFLLENVLDCWRHEGSLDAVMDYDRFNESSVRQVVDVVGSVDNVFTRAEKTEVDAGMDVAVVGYSDFDEIDRQVLPESFDIFEVLRDRKTELPEFKLYGSATDIVRSVAQAVEEQAALDIAVVARRGSIFSTLVRSMLESRGIAINRRKDLREHRDLRTLIRTLRLAVNSERRRVEECRSVLNWLDVQIHTEKDREFVSDIESDESRKLEKTLEYIGESTLRDAIDRLDGHMDTDLGADLEQLGILDSEVSEQLIARLEYFLDTYNVGKESARNGVLLADPTSSEVVDRPIVFHLGMGSGWTPNIPDRPWIDREEEDARNLKRFKYLIQNGEQRHYLVQEKSMGEDVAPSLYINELAGGEIESFRDLPKERYQIGSIPDADGFEPEQFSVECGDIEVISQSSLNSLAQSPRDYLFDDLADGPGRDYFRRGNLYHDYAEFYANHPEVVDSRGRERFVEMMLHEMRSIVDDLRLDTLETEFRIGMENIEEFIDKETGERPQIDAFRHKYGDNTFAQKLNVDIANDLTEAWFEDPKLGVKGAIDLVASETQLADYKTGMRKSPSNVVRHSNIDLVTDGPRFQSILYLTELRKATSNKELDFTFLHFLENEGRRVVGQGNIQEATAQVTYYPTAFSKALNTESARNYLYASVREKLLDNLGKEYVSVMSDIELDRESQYDKSVMTERHLESFKNLCSNYVEMGRGSGRLTEKQLHKSCKSLLKQVVEFRTKNYFREDLDDFEEFLQNQLDLLNEYRNTRFPVENPEIEGVDHSDLNNRDMIPL